MKILTVTQGANPQEVVLRVLMKDEEFKRLAGRLDGICVFATEVITERSSVIRCGARHARVKYLLFPSGLRKEFKADPFDFENMVCSAFEENGELYVVFKAPKRPTRQNSH